MTAIKDNVNALKFKRQSESELYARKCILRSYICDLELNANILH